MVIFEPTREGSLLTAEVPPDPVAVDNCSGGPDPATVAYILSIRPVFEAVRHAAAQVAAFLILATTGSHAAGPDHPLLVEACSAIQEATDGLRTAVGGAEDAVHHHHHHLLRARAGIEGTLSVLQGSAWTKDRATLDPVLKRLKAAWQELHWATAALPGFEMVELRQSCCAGHSFAKTNG